MRCLVLLLAVMSVCCAFSPNARAVTPAPDGGYPFENTAEGDETLFRLILSSSSFGNTAIGFHALRDMQTGVGNTATGAEALEHNTSSYNTATGFDALGSNTTGQANTAVGNSALASNTAGIYSTAMGINALRANTASENTAFGGDALAQNTTGSQNTASGFRALSSNTTGFSNTGTGYNALSFNKSGVGNVADGNFALYKNTTGGNNTATGNFALLSNTIGNDNTASGSTALEFNSTGSSNTAFGSSALLNNTGSLNVALGNRAAYNLTTGSNNIVIGAGVLGAAGDANKIRIGKSTHTATYIGGIYNKTVASGTGVGVMIDANGKLGTVVSSARFKEAIKPMHKASEAILALQPVTFRYKHELDPDGLPQFGLIAEQVEKVDANLVVRGEDGKVSTVRYEAVNAMLLNEFLKEHRKVEEQQATITRLESRLAKQELTGAQQHKQIEALTATVQKVSDEVALSRPASQLVTNP